MQLLTITPEDLKLGFGQGKQSSEQFCRGLESGRIVYFPESPVELAEESRQFLLGLKQVGASYHKNIAYRPSEHRVTGFVRENPADSRRLLEVMGDYSRTVRTFLSRFLEPYAATWRVDYASFRPQEEKGRKLKETSRNDLLHVDAFPTRPTNGDRILRFFTNINPAESRVWWTTDPFETLIERYGEDCGFLPKNAPSLGWRIAVALKRGLASAGVPVVARSRYDEFMLAFHDYLKTNPSVQNGPKYEWEFPTLSSWMVFTDLVPHAAKSGRFALEQTLIISRGSLLLPERAPVNVLERCCGRALT